MFRTHGFLWSHTRSSHLVDPDPAQPDWFVFSDMEPSAWQHRMSGEWIRTTCFTWEWNWIAEPVSIQPDTTAFVTCSTFFLPSLLHPSRCS